jgi:hypothetical protein
MCEGYKPFSDDDDLSARLRHGLRQWLSQRYIAPVLAADAASVTLPANDARQLEQHLRRYLDDRLAQEFSDRVERYVPMAGLERVSRSPHNGRRNLRFAPRLDLQRAG